MLRRSMTFMFDGRLGCGYILRVIFKGEAA